jgi:hydrogenase-4 component E
MNLTLCELIIVSSAVAAILMAGSMHLRVNLAFYSLQTILIAAATWLIAQERSDNGLIWVAFAIGAIKGAGIPWFLSWIIRKIQSRSDIGAVLTAPLAMHLSVIFLGVSYMFSQGLPVPEGAQRGWPGATAAISLVLTGVVIMLTRRVAISQVLGFLVIENGIYLFALTQTIDMPMIVEMGVLLDVLVGVMIAGLLIFRIKKSFEHIDVTQLADLKD